MQTRDSVGSRRLFSFRVSQRCASEDELSNADETATIIALIAECHEHEITIIGSCFTCISSGELLLLQFQMEIYYEVLQGLALIYDIKNCLFHSFPIIFDASSYQKILIHAIRRSNRAVQCTKSYSAGGLTEFSRQFSTSFILSHITHLHIFCSHTKLPDLENVQETS